MPSFTIEEIEMQSVEGICLISERLMCEAKLTLGMLRGENSQERMCPEDAEQSKVLAGGGWERRGFQSHRCVLQGRQGCSSAKGMGLKNHNISVMKRPLVAGQLSLNENLKPPVTQSKPKPAPSPFLGQPCL